jgi:hypothetical protein
MDPLPMGVERVSEPELCDISFGNGGNDRFLFEIGANRMGHVTI